MKLTIVDREHVVFASHDLDADSWKGLADMLRDASLTADLSESATDAVVDLITAGRRAQKEGDAGENEGEDDAATN